MFPLKNTEAYIHANGFRSTLGKELADRDAEISELGSEIQALTNYVTETGVKNLLENDATDNTYATGLTVAVNDNKEIKINGTSSNYTIILVNADIKLEEGKRYKLSGCPSGGSGSTYKLEFNLPSGFATDFGDGIEFTYATKSEGNNCRIVVYGGTYNNLTIKPMITEVGIPNSDYAHYQPYAKTNVELTQDKIDLASLQTVVAASSDFADFQTRIAAL